jgi:hypothetical protein
MSRAAMQQALDAIEGSGCKAELIAAADALRAAPAEQPQPVAWMVKDEGLYWTEEAAIRRADQFVEPLDVVPLYTTPPTPQPLRDLCAAAYQAVGVADGPVEMLDNLWAAAEGKPLPHDPGAGLPWSPPAPQPVADDDIDILTAKSRDDLMDFIYEYGTTSEGQQRFIRQIARAVEAEVLKRMGVGK